MGAYLKDKGTVNSLVTEITIKETLLQFPFLSFLNSFKTGTLSASFDGVHIEQK